ncbi:MAG: HD domain-containing protein [Deltaproteobacteria bacterium]|nr:HD domain-containing protein [Deltaproteobacteria bacterium]
MTETLFIKTIQDGQQVEGVFLLKELIRAETKGGKPFLTVKLMDKTGEVTGRIWDEADRWEQECSPGQAVGISGRAQSYKGNLQLVITEVRGMSASEIDLAQFIPSTSGDIDRMAEELTDLARGVADVFIKKLLLKFFTDQEFMTKFKKGPAAKSMHHAYLGGLLEHTLHVAQLADKVTELYPSINRSLLLAGAMLHDVGKVEELAITSTLFDYSDQGRLMGHMVIGVEMVQEKIARIKDFPQDLAVKIKHLILSHHGSHEFGSPTLPMLHEAFVLNFLDDLDAKTNYLERLSAQIPENEYRWSEYQRNLERFLFLSGHATQSREEETPPAKKKKTATDQDVRQPSLFDSL